MNRKQMGFSLIEVMIAMAVIAILSSIALPAYQDQIRTSKRTEAQNLLLEAASKQQRFFSDNMSFGMDMGDLGYGAANNNAEATESAAYTVSVNPAVDGSSYTLLATPTASQANDGCGNLGISNTGVKSETGTRSLKECWK